MYDRIDWQHRMVGLTGSRGVGKTTLLLQRIKEKLPRKDVLYVSMDDLYFSEHSLVELADHFHTTGGNFLFLDEVHKYPDWSRELKLIYDYHPALHIVFTGSSILDITKGTSDLSRRAVMYEMQGLSFREYLSLHLVAPLQSAADTRPAGGMGRRDVPPLGLFPGLSAAWLLSIPERA